MPYIVRQCVEEIERRGMEEVGIYRVSGVATDIQALKAAFDVSEWRPRAAWGGCGRAVRAVSRGAFVACARGITLCTFSSLKVKRKPLWEAVLPAPVLSPWDQAWLLAELDQGFPRGPFCWGSGCSLGGAARGAEVPTEAQGQRGCPAIRPCKVSVSLPSAHQEADKDTKTPGSPQWPPQPTRKALA